MASGSGVTATRESRKCDILQRLYDRLVHILERYDFTFGGTDGYSRKIMYLKVADNNRSDTHLAFFSEAVNKHGFPLRVHSYQRLNGRRVDTRMRVILGSLSLHWTVLSRILK